MSDRRILIQFVHPARERSAANRVLLDAVAGLPGVTVNDLYAAYPDWKIDVAREQGLLVENDVIVFQHPLYWSSCPALLKEWIDCVLELGFAFPPGKGDELNGKKWLQVVTAGGKEESYEGAGSRFPMADLMRPFESTADFCGMIWQKPFAVYGVRSSGDDVSLAEAAGAYRKLLEKI